MTDESWRRYKTENPQLSTDVVVEVEKMLRCHDPNYGYRTYRCPECMETMRIPFACKSRICTHCGKMHADNWADKLAEILYNVSHRHMVFTIPEESRTILNADRKLHTILMDAVSQTMKRMIKDGRRAMPGVVCVLHPYGRDLELNPHVHALATEGGLAKRGEWIPVTFLEYGKLRRIWQYELLTNLKQGIPRSQETNQLITASSTST